MKTIKMLAVIPATGLADRHASSCTLEELQKAVGGYIEELPKAFYNSNIAEANHFGNGRRKVWVNEEGRINGMPRNLLAERLLGVKIYLYGPVAVQYYLPLNGLK